MGQSPVLLLLGLAWLGFCSAAVPSLSTQDLLTLAKVDSGKAFASWASQHGKDYKCPKMHAKKQSVFLDNVARIEQLQQEHPATQFALNEYADLTWEEFSKSRLGLQFDDHAKTRRLARNSGFRYAGAEVPTEIDWRDKGAVTDVKNQGQCGSCWAFATTGSVEGANALYTGELISLSEQELVDCDTKEDQGCNGGLMDNAYQYIIENGGIDTEADYGYWSGYGFGFMCNKRKQKDRKVVTIDGYEDVPISEADLKRAVAHQPVAVGICAGSSLQFYAGGVLTKCCEGLNHGVLAVGYGTDTDGSTYWIVKNSWGAGWGEKGYFRLKYGVGKDGLCGIAQAASYPVKTSPNPEGVPEMCDMFGWTECPARQTCSCSFSLFGFVCLWHDCCPLDGGVTCPDLKHCCPSDAPICDIQQASCVSQDGLKVVPWTDKAKALAKAPGKDAVQPAVLPANGFVADPVRPGQVSSTDPQRPVFTEGMDTDFLRQMPVKTVDKVEEATDIANAEAESTHLYDDDEYVWSNQDDELKAEEEQKQWEAELQQLKEKEEEYEQEHLEEEEEQKQWEAAVKELEEEEERLRSQDEVEPEDEEDSDDDEDDDEDGDSDEDEDEEDEEDGDSNEDGTDDEDDDEHEHEHEHHHDHHDHGHGHEHGEGHGHEHEHHHEHHAQHGDAHMPADHGNEQMPANHGETMLVIKALTEQHQQM